MSDETKDGDWVANDWGYQDPMNGDETKSFPETEFEKAMRESVMTEKNRDAIRAHVAEKDRKLSEYEKLKNEMLEVVNLGVEFKRSESDLSRCIAELEREIARLESHNATWLDRYTELERERDELKARIEGAPKVWILWKVDHDGKWFACNVLTNPSEKEQRWFMSEHSRLEQVYAVPVTEPSEAKDRESVEAEERKEEAEG